MTVYNRLRRYAAGILVLACMFALLCVPARADNAQITVLLNGAPVDFPDNPPYLDAQAGRIYVPIRAVSESLRAEVSYEQQTGTVTITRGSTTILLTLGSGTAQVNGVSVALDAPAFAENGSTYVPLRFVSENLSLSVQWDAPSMTVRMQSVPALTDGMGEAALRQLYGAPVRTALSERGYTWWIWDDLSDYRMYGVDDGTVVARYEQNAGWVLDCGLRFGMERSACGSLLGEPERDEYDHYCTYFTGDTAVTVYFDENDCAYAVLEELAGYANSCTVTVSVLEGTAQILRDLVNAARADLGLAPLSNDETITQLARDHSADMAGGNFYAHTGSDGRSSQQRLADAGCGDCFQTQIIAKSYPNAMAAFCDHVNNDRYRSVMTADYASLGVGVAYNAQSDGLFYYTQIFFSEK